jgi:hypothetical protein
VRRLFGACTTGVVEFDDIADGFVRTAHSIVWCNVATVDRHGRPRSRVLHAIWELAPGVLHGWVITRPSPIKVAHLRMSPFVSCSYSDRVQGIAIADCGASWVDDVGQVRRIWDLFLNAPSPLGYDFTNAYPSGPTDPECVLLHLEPWRLLVNDAAGIAAGQRSAVWSAER